MSRCKKIHGIIYGHGFLDLHTETLNYVRISTSFFVIPAEIIKIFIVSQTMVFFTSCALKHAI